MSNDPKPPSKSPDAGLCAEMSGFLFQHPCGMFARYQCDQCGKPICGQHSALVDNRNLCTSCSKPPTGQPQSQTPDQSGNREWHSAAYWADVDVDWDPNTSDAPTWYRKKRRHPRTDEHHDFTDADESLFEAGEDEGVKWENDMGAS